MKKSKKAKYEKTKKSRSGAKKTLVSKKASTKRNVKTNVRGAKKAGRKAGSRPKKSNTHNRYFRKLKPGKILILKKQLQNRAGEKFKIKKLTEKFKPSLHLTEDNVIDVLLFLQVKFEDLISKISLRKPKQVIFTIIYTMHFEGIRRRQGISSPRTEMSSKTKDRVLKGFLQGKVFKNDSKTLEDLFFSYLSRKSLTNITINGIEIEYNL